MNTNQGSSVEFPAFCVADPAAARRRLPALGSTWAARFKESREFPQLETVPVEAGSLVFTESAFDLGGRPGVRIYLVPELLNAVQRALGWSDADEVMAAFETGIRRACWGALSLVTGRRRPDTVGSVRTRIKQPTRRPGWMPRRRGWRSWRPAIRAFETRAHSRIQPCCGNASPGSTLRNERR